MFSAKLIALTLLACLSTTSIAQGTFVVESVQPTTLINRGDNIVEARGNFTAGSFCFLSRFNDVIHSTAARVSAGKITCNFSLEGYAEPSFGGWSFYVSSSDRLIRSAPRPISIGFSSPLPGNDPSIRGRLIVEPRDHPFRIQVRPGGSLSMELELVNSRPTPEYLIPVVISWPASVDVEPDLSVVRLPLQANQGLPPTPIPRVIRVGDQNVLSLVINRIRAGETLRLPVGTFRFRGSATPSDFNFSLVVLRPLIATRQPVNITRIGNDPTPGTPPPTTPPGPTVPPTPGTPPFDPPDPGPAPGNPPLPPLDPPPIPVDPPPTIPPGSPPPTPATFPPPVPVVDYLPTGSLDDCASEIVRVLIKRLLPGGQCIVAMAQALRKIGLEQSVEEPQVFSLSEFIWDNASGILQCAASLTPAGYLADLALTLGRTISAANNAAGAASCFVGLDNSGVFTQLGNAFDPNFKIGGPRSGDAVRWVGFDQRIYYRIYFENLPSASLPAATVTIIDRLDASKLNLDSIDFLGVSWGNKLLTYAPTTSRLDAIESVSPRLAVRIRANLDRGTSSLRWQFETIDPVTQAPPQNSALGFLPPNVDGTEGQGYVEFSVVPLSTAGQVQIIENASQIIFDTNAAIITNTWVTEIDRAPPTSAVLNAIQIGQTKDVAVNWMTADRGSGVSSFVVDVSENGGPFTEWFSGTTENAATYPGQFGSSYRFRIRALDRVGNVEGEKSGFDVEVRVLDSLAAPNPPSSGTGGGGGCTVADASRGLSDPTLLAMLLLAVLGLARRKLWSN